MMCKYVVQLSDDSGSLPGESPYIGKGRFHENEYAVERQVHTKPKEVQYAAVNAARTSAVSDIHAVVSQGQLDSIHVDGDDQHQQIDIELQEKVRTLAEGWL